VKAAIGSSLPLHKAVQRPNRAPLPRELPIERADGLGEERAVLEVARHAQGADRPRLTGRRPALAAHAARHLLLAQVMQGVRQHAPERKRIDHNVMASCRSFYLWGPSTESLWRKMPTLDAGSRLPFAREGATGKVSNRHSAPPVQ
jgi:hypothetical protein